MGMQCSFGSHRFVVSYLKNRREKFRKRRTTPAETLRSRIGHHDSAATIEPPSENVNGSFKFEDGAKIISLDSADFKELKQVEYVELHVYGGIQGYVEYRLC